MTTDRGSAPLVLCGLLSLAGCRAQLPVSRSAPADPREAPFEGLRAPALELNGAVMEVELHPECGIRGTVEGQALQLGFDTGQSFPLLLSRHVVDRFGWPTVGAVETGDGSGLNSQDLDVVRVPRMRVGDALFTDVDALVLEMEADGSLGLPMFADCLVTLDLARDRIHVERGELPAPDGATVFEYSLESGTPSVAVWLGVVRCQADIDNGSEAGIVAPLTLAGSLDLESRPVASGRIATLFNEAQLWTATLAGGLHVGPHAIDGPEVQFAEIFPVVNLGRQVLREFVLVFDQRHQRVRFLRSPAGLRSPARYDLLPGRGSAAKEGVG